MLSSSNFDHLLLLQKETTFCAEILPCMSYLASAFRGGFLCLPCALRITPKLAAYAAAAIEGIWRLKPAIEHGIKGTMTCLSSAKQFSP